MFSGARSDRVWMRGWRLGGYPDRIRLRTREHVVGAACQSQGRHALKHTLFYCLFYNKLDHNLQNENIIPCLKRLKTRDRDHEHIRKPYSEVMN